MLEVAKVDPAVDTVRFLGDYVDRGKKSYEVIQTVREYQRRGAKVQKGNHEDMYLAWLLDLYGPEDKENYIENNGGGNTVRSFQANPHDHVELVDWMMKLPYYDEDEEYIYVHAGIDPFQPSIAATPNDSFVWVRDHFLYAPNDLILYHTDGRKVVHGHTPMSRVWDDGARINIDTGAGSRYALSLVDLTNRITYTYSFKHEQVYINPIEEVEVKPRR